MAKRAFLILWRMFKFCGLLALLFFACAYSCNGQSIVAPTYTGQLSTNVFFIGIANGKNVKIPGSRIRVDTGSGGTVTPVDSFSDGNAVVGLMVPGSGVVDVITARNGYGYVTFTNTSGSPIGAGVQIKVAYSVPSATGVPIPVVSTVSPGTTPTLIYTGLTIRDPSNNSFIVELQNNIAAGATAGFTYLVKKL